MREASNKWRKEEAGERRATSVSQEKARLQNDFAWRRNMFIQKKKERQDRVGLVNSVLISTLFASLRPFSLTGILLSSISIDCLGS